MALHSEHNESTKSKSLIKWHIKWAHKFPRLIYQIRLYFGTNKRFLVFVCVFVI